MRKTAITFLFCISIISVLAIAESIVFPDILLKDAIEKELGISDPNASDMLLLTKLAPKRCRSTSLEGIQYAKNLKSLKLSFCNIAEINNLAGLKNLESLDLRYNKISDISALTNLTKLKKLSLNDNKISNISLLSKFTKLESLDIYGNQIADISPIANLTKLKSLDIGDNEITDISEIAKLTNLKELSISRNEISDLSPIAGLKNLTSLTIHENNIKDISAISGMTKLKEIFLRDNPINNLYVVKSLPGLTKFNFFKVTPGFDPVPEYTFIQSAIKLIILIFFGASAAIYILILTIRAICKKQFRPFMSLFQMLLLVLIAAVSVSLIFVLYFHTHAKVLCALATILCSGGVLLIPYKKRMLICGGVLAVGLMVCVLLPDGKSDWKPYTLEKELAIFNTKHAIPSQENAATIYDVLFKNHDPNSGDLLAPYLDGEDSTAVERGFWKSEDFPEISKWLKQHQELMGSLVAAGKRPKCYFPFSLETQLPYSLGKLGDLKQACMLLIISANNDIAEGKTDLALEKYQACLHIGTHLEQQPNLMSYLVAVACHALAENRLNELVVTGKLTRKQLSDIEQMVKSIPIDWQSLWTNIVEGERFIAKRYLIIDYEVNSSGKTRISLNTDKGILLETKKLLKVPTGHDTIFDSKALFIMATGLAKWFYVPSSPEKASAVIEDIHKDYFEMAESDYDWDREVEQYPAKELMLDYRKICSILDLNRESFVLAHKFYLEKMARRSALLLMVELKQFHNNNNHWPDSLAELKSISAGSLRDPVSKGRFVYRKVDDGFMLYSKGHDDIDHNGESTNRHNRKAGEPDDILFWPRKLRK